MSENGSVASFPHKKTLPQIKALIEVAQGLRPADAYIKGGRIVNVYSGEILDGNVALWDRWIAYVGLSDRMIGAETRIIDARGYYLVPGYIDPHAHTDLLYYPTAFAEQALLTGTTTVFSDSFYLTSIFGEKQFLSFLTEIWQWRIKFFTGVRIESQSFPETDKDVYNEGTLDRLLDDSRILGLSEITCWTMILGQDDDLLSKVTQASNKSKRIEGHTSGCTYDRLNAIVAAGFTSCHEGITAEQALDRLRLGLWIMLRQGSIRQDMPALAPLITQYKADPSRVMLTPDGMYPLDMVEKGYMDYVIKETMACGIPPITAIQMATINPATYLGIDGEVGGISPGRFADILFLTDPKEPTPELVIAEGTTVAHQGKPVVEYPPPKSHRLAKNKCRRVAAGLGRISPDLFKIDAKDGEAELPIIHLVDHVINKRVNARLKAKDGSLQCDPDKDILHVSLVDSVAGRVTNAFLSGFGAKIGGLASTGNVTRDLLVVGVSPEDMALAANRVVELGGALVITNRGRVEFELELPIGGVMNPGSVKEISGKMKELTEYVTGLNFRFRDPHLILDFLCVATLPTLRLSPAGLYDAREGRIIYPSRPIDHTAFVSEKPEQGAGYYEA